MPATKRQPARQAPKKRPGRPTALSYELGGRVIDLVRKGNYVEVAAQACGIRKSRLYDWISKAAEWDEATEEQLEKLDDETQMFIWFRDAYKEAEALAEIDLLAKVDAAESHWQAHMTIMQRRFGKRWREKTDLDIDLTGEVSQRIELSSEDVSELEKAFGLAGAVAVARGPEHVEPPADD